MGSALLQSYRGRLHRLHSELNKSGQEIDDEGLISCSSSETKSTSHNTTAKMIVHGLERLCIADNHLSPVGMQAVAVILMQTPKSLVTKVGGLVSLDLSYNQNIRDTGVEILCEGLLRNNTLKELYLRSIRMSFPGILIVSITLYYLFMHWI